MDWLAVCSITMERPAMPFLLVGVEPNETLMASAIRHCRRLVDFRVKPSHRL
jgi:hypothetical protein